MKHFTKVIILAVVVFAIYYAFTEQGSKLNNTLQSNIPIQSQNNLPQTDAQRVSVIAENLDTPWGIAFLPDGNLLITERQGTVRLVQNNGSQTSNVISTLSKVKEIGEGGLLGIALHPNFSSNNYVYLYYTYDGSSNPTLNRVVRMKFQNKSLADEQIIVDAIPGNSNHNGGRIKFGPDGYLYITTGDAQNPSRSQDKNSLAGKILRTTDEGKSVPGNPFGNLVYSMGHRNPQGIAWDNSGQLWSTEHGRSGVLSGLDEVNLIENGKNYGWDTIQGDETRAGLETPVRHSGNDTWAPAGVAIIGQALFFAGLRGQALYEVTLDGKQITNFLEHFKGEFGRIREVIAGFDGMLYITTSNNDGRGKPNVEDDKILKINPESCKLLILNTKYFILFTKHDTKCPLLEFSNNNIDSRFAFSNFSNKIDYIKLRDYRTNNSTPTESITCADFQTQKEAQGYFDTSMGSVKGLDGDNDGVVCEGLP